MSIMITVVTVLVVLAIGMVLLLVVAALVGRGEALPPVTEAEIRAQVSQELTAAELRAVRLPLDVRGYRMRDVDLVLEAAASRIAALEAELAESQPAITVEDAQHNAH